MNTGLPASDVAGRCGRLEFALAARELPALLVTNRSNVRYLTGFTGSIARVLVAPGRRPALVVDGRYRTQAEEELAAHAVDADLLVAQTMPEIHAAMAAWLRGSASCGFEAATVTVAEHERFAGALGVGLTPTTDLVEQLRAVKDDGEIARLERASAIASAALADVIASLDEGPTEAEFARALDRRMVDLGASGPSFDTIVASGPNAAKAHARPGDRRISTGDSLVIDFGAEVDGYHSDMTRTALLGPVDPWLVEAFEVVERAQAAGVAAASAGIDGQALDAVCRDSITADGFGEWFTHGTGHGIGLDIHESPWAIRGSQDVLVAGNVVTVEPGVYRGELGGVRIEDAVVITTDGCRPLTLTPKDLSCLRSPPTTSRPE
ncbi:MAG: Xaa-Pro peptidase family protein [Ilumatobacteraceae bacterium]